MKPELQNKLFKTYPKLFIQKDLSMQQTCMCWGCECGDGWYWLIDQLCECIQRYIDSNNKKQLEIVQIKEKFGSLRLYINGADEIIHGMIWLAENISENICEICGSIENVTQTDGWIYTRCQKCLNKS